MTANVTSCGSHFKFSINILKHTNYMYKDITFCLLCNLWFMFSSEFCGFSVFFFTENEVVKYL